MAKIQKSNVRLEMLINSKPYKDPKSIAIQYALGEGISIQSYSVKSEGLDLSKAIDLNDQTQTINLSLNGDKGCISIVFNLSDSTQETVKFFAIKASKGVYFSRRSFEQAERISLQGELTATNYVTEMIRRQGISISPIPKSKARSLSPKSPITSSVYKLDIQWQDSEGKIHPARRLKIAIYANKCLKDAYTDNKGHFEFTATSEDIKSKMYILVRSATDCCNVSETRNGQPHTFIKEYCINNDKSYTFVIARAHNMSEIDAAIHAIQISQAITFGYDYVQVMSKNTFNQKLIQVVYPNEYGQDNQTSYYSDTYNTLNIYESAYLCWDILLHEFGHLLQKKYGIAKNPGLSHFVDNDQIEDHKSKDKGIRLAWGEAWPTTFGLMVTQYYGLKDYPRVADTYYDANNGEYRSPTDYWRRNMETNRSNPLGEGCELDVYCLLYDMYDNGREPGEDEMSMSHEAFWNLVTSSKAKTLSDFVHYAYNNGYNRETLYQILSAHGVSGKILSLEDRKLNIQVGGNPNNTNSRQNKAIVYYANYSTCDFFKNVTTSSLNFPVKGSNKTYVDIPLKEIYQDPGAKMQCCLGTWQTNKPSTGVYYSPWKTLEKKLFLSNAYFFPTDDFSFLTKRTKKWQSKSVQINNHKFTVQGYNVMYSAPWVLINVPGSAGSAAVSIQSPLTIYGIKLSVYVDVPTGYIDFISGADVRMSISGITQDNKSISIATKRLLGNSPLTIRKSGIRHFIIKGFTLKSVTITVTTSKISSKLAKNIKVRLGNILLSSSSTMPDFF